MESKDFDSLFSSSNADYANMDNLFSSGSDEQEDYKDYERDAELKKKELYRKGKLQYEDDGTLINDSNAMIRAKEVANAGIRGVDWLLEASENIADFGQGDLIGHYDGFMAENQGKRYSMDNKDFIAARDLGPNATQKLIEQYKNAKHDPNADKGVYTLRKFDGYNPDGSEKYIYKYGLAEVGADTRYRDQLVQDGFDIVEEKRFAGAEDWEKTWNASQGVLDARVLDNSIDKVQDAEGNWVTRDEASGINFGSGKTELLNRDLLGTDIGKTQEDYDRNRAYSERLSKMADARWQSGMSDSVVDALQSGTAKTLVDTADFLLDIFTPSGDNTLLNNAKKQENIDKFVGYDRTQSTQALSDAATYWNQGDYLKAIKNVVTDPNTMVESIPMMIAMMAPIPGTKVGKVASMMKTMDKAKKAGAGAKELAGLERAWKVEALKKLPAEDADKLITTYNNFKTAPAKLKVFDHFAKNAGFHTTVGAMTNNVLDDRIAEKIKNGEPGSVDMGEVLGVYALQLPLLAIDRMSFKAILGMGKEGKALKLAFDSLDDVGKKQVLSAVAKKGAEMAASGAGEGAQEYVQTWGEILGTNAFVGDKSVSDVLNNEQNQREALMGGLGGLGAGVQMHGIGHAVPDIAKGTKEAYDRYSEDDSKKGIRKVKTIDDFNSNKDIISSDFGKEIINQIVEPEYNKIEDFNTEDTESFKKVIKSMLDRRMQNAFNRDGTKEEEKYQIQEVLSRSLDAAMLNFAKDKDKAKLDNVLGFIKKVNDDKDINFESKDLSAERNNDLFEKFVELSKKKYKPRNTGSDSAEMTGNKDLEARNKADIEAQKQADYEELLKDIDSQIYAQILSSQGSSVNMDKDGNVEYDPKIFDSSEGISPLELKKQVQEYIKQGGKNFKQASDEIQKYGYIVYDEGKGDGIVLKDSMTSYDNSLAKEFRNPDKLKLALSKSVGAKKSGTFQKFINWAKQRAEKLGTYNGKGSSWTASALSDMESENQWFEKKIKTLEGMLGSHGTKVIDDTTRASIQNELTQAKSALKTAKKKTAEHREQLKKYVEDVLGLEGFDFNNKEHVRQLAGVQTNYKKGENGFEFGPMKVKVMKKPGSTLQSSQEFMRDRLLGLDGIKSKPNFKGFDNSNVEINTNQDLSGTATGSDNVKQTKQKTEQKEKQKPIQEPENYKTNKAKQTYQKQSEVKEDSQRANNEHLAAQELLKKTKYGIVEDMTEEEYLNIIEEVVQKGTATEDPAIRKKWRMVYAALTKNEIYAKNDAKSKYYQDIHSKENQKKLEDNINELYSKITGHTDVVINDVIEYISKIETLLKDYGIDGTKYQKEFGNIADRIGTSLSEDKKMIEDLYEDYKELQQDKRNENKTKKQTNEDTKKGKSIIAKIKSIISKINKQMKALKARFINKMISTEQKKMIKNDFESLSGNVFSGSEMETELQNLVQTYRYLESNKNKYKDMAISEYPNLETFLKTVKRLTGRFSRGKSQDIYNDARRKYNDEEYDIIAQDMQDKAEFEAEYEAETKRREEAEKNKQTATNTTNDTISIEDVKLDSEEALQEKGIEDSETVEMSEEEIQAKIDEQLKCLK